jgi:hypothetical protein
MIMSALATSSTPRHLVREVRDEPNELSIVLPHTEGCFAPKPLPIASNRDAFLAQHPSLECLTFSFEEMFPVEHLSLLENAASLGRSSRLPCRFCLQFFNGFCYLVRRFVLKADHVVPRLA